MNKYRVLVVDDQIMSRQLFESVINGADDFILANSISTANLADIYCAREDIDLVIMDIVMKSGPNGLEMAEKIKSTYPRTKILMVTSVPDASLIEKARRIGVESFWYKEVQDEPLLNVMRKTMQGENVYPDSTPVIKLGLANSSDFTDREIEVLRMLVRGYSDKEIAVELDMSYHTVRFHMNSLLTKTGCTSRTDLAIQVAKSGIAISD